MATTVYMARDGYYITNAIGTTTTDSSVIP